MSKEPEELPDLEELPELDELEPMEEPEPLEPVEETPAAAAPPPAPEPAPEPPPPAPAPTPEPEPAPAPEPEPPAASAPAPVAEETSSVVEEEVAAPAAPAASVPMDVPPPGKEPPRPTKKPGEKRELEKAPLHLRKAAMIVGAGALFPFFTALKPDVAISWGPLLGAKALALLSGWIFHQGYMATHGGHGVDFMEKLAKAHKLVPPIVAGLVSIGALGVSVLCSSPGGAFGEVATLLLAYATFSHIWAYEHGGKFNPIFPLMFLGPAISGLLNTIGAAGQFGIEGHQGIPALGMLGSLVVGAGGLMAIYTMYEAMKQAKIDGDIKKEQMRQYRKQQRDAQRAERAKQQDDKS